MFRRCAKFLLLSGIAWLALHAAGAAETYNHFHPVSSADAQLRPHEAHLTLAEALHLAQAEAQRNKVSLNGFEQPWFRFYRDNYGQYLWAFHYDKKMPDGMAPAPGDDFFVIVDDRTQHADYSPGQ
jgi:hypothetical protein